MSAKDSDRQFIDDFELDARDILKTTEVNKPVIQKRKVEVKENDDELVGPSIKKIPKCKYLLK